MKGWERWKTPHQLLRLRKCTTTTQLRICFQIHSSIQPPYFSSWWFFTNPFEKYAICPSNWVHLPQIFGVKIQKIWMEPPPILFVGRLEYLTGFFLKYFGMSRDSPILKVTMKKVEVRFCKRSMAPALRALDVLL